MWDGGRRRRQGDGHPNAQQSGETKGERRGGTVCIAGPGVVLRQMGRFPGRTKHLGAEGKHRFQAG
eukprot:1083057-Pyramimonas_sp.AAC.1